MNAYNAEKISANNLKNETTNADFNKYTVKQDIADKLLNELITLKVEQFKADKKMKDDVYDKYAANEKTVYELLTKAKEPQASVEDKKLVVPLTGL